MTNPFVHLHVRTTYSMLRSSLRISSIAELCQRHAMPAVAITDNAMFGVLEFAFAMERAGVQPIIGCTVPLRLEAHPARRASKDDIRDLVLLAATEEGYRNLMELSSRTWESEEGTATQPSVTLHDVGQCNQGLIALSGGIHGPLHRFLDANDYEGADALSQQLSTIFPERLYVEIPTVGTDATHVEALLALAAEHSLPAVAANDCHFAMPQDHQATVALRCIGDGRSINEAEPEGSARLLSMQDFSSPEEMARRCARFPSAYTNASELAKRCLFWPRARQPMLPSSTQSAVSEEHVHEAGAVATTSSSRREHEAETLRTSAERGLEERLRTLVIPEHLTREDYRQRLHSELDIIIRMDFSGYFLIVADFVSWAKDNDIPVGPGRGSGAASLVAYSVRITDIDPLRYDLLFERFLNPERISMPDFDIDLCQDRRGEVISYVQNKYGSERVAQIITFGSLQPRAVLRDVGRVMGLPYGRVDRLARLVPFVPANPPTLQSALDEVPELAAERDKDETIQRLIEYSLRLEGLYRHASTHAAGVVIADVPLRDLVPLYREPRSTMPITQFSMNWVEPAGLVKFDFLGLKTLTIIKDIERALRARGIEIDTSQLPIDDAKTFAMMSAAETIGVFQFESPPMRSWLLKLMPSRFEDMIAMVALYRPGPMENIPAFIDRKHGREEIDWIHDQLRGVLSDTYGVIIYQEQVIRIAQILAGYSGGEADLLRRAMGKKKPEEMKMQRDRFVEGARDNDISEKRASGIFDLVAKFAGYGFNKAHATCYAWVSYQTAWLKANYPVEFLAASMSADIGNVERISTFVREAQRLGIAILPPCVKRSQIGFAVEGGAIRYGLAAIRGVGHSVAAAIVGQVEQAGSAASLGDWLNDSNANTLKRRALEALIAAGALDCFGYARSQLYANAEVMLRQAAHTAQQRASGQSDLFALSAGDNAAGEAAENTLYLQPARDWSQAETMAQEFQALGLYLSGHPLQQWLPHYRALGLTTAEDFQAQVMQDEKASGWMAGVVTKVSTRKTRNNNSLRVIELSDPTTHFEAAAYSETCAGKEELLQVGAEIVLAIAVSSDNDNRWRCNDIEWLNHRIGKRLRRLAVYVSDSEDLHRAAQCLSPGGDCEISLMTKNADGGRVRVQLPGHWQLGEQAWQALDIRPAMQQ